MTDESSAKQAADAAYASGDLGAAAAGYLAAAAEQTDGAGASLHLAGNAFMKLGRFDEAVEAYRRAVGDPTYDRRAAVYVNLGMALSSLERHEEALDAYDAALADVDYATPHKALQGRATALFALGRYEDAAAAYRKAAWSDGNADPGKALNNLGLSFMALDKPQEAVEAFRGALAAESYASKGKAAVNLALAYAAMGFVEEAVASFESARDDHGHVLAGDTLRAYEEAKTAMQVGEDEPIDVPVDDLEREVPDTLEQPESETVTQPQRTAPVLPDADDEQTAKFFNMSEDEMRDIDRAARKEKRAAERTPRSIALRVGIAIAIVVVLAGAVFGVLYAGFGYPTQEQTVSGLIDAYRAGQPYTAYWVAVPTADVKEEMRALPAKFKGYSIEGIERHPTRSTALVVIELESGSKLAYDVKLAREGVGWKVVGVENRWDSTQN